MTTKNKTPADRYTVSQLAHMFGMAHNTAAKRIDGAEYVAHGSRRYYLIRHVAGKLMKVDEDRLDPAAEIARVNAERADQLELKNAVARHEQVPVTLLVDAVSRATSQAAAALDAIPAELRRANPALTQTDIAMVRRAIAKARNTAAAVEIDWTGIDA